MIGMLLDSKETLQVQETFIDIKTNMDELVNTCTTPHTNFLAGVSHNAKQYFSLEIQGVEITLCCMVVSHARELISFFAQFEHLPYLFFIVLGCFPNKLLVFILYLCVHYFEFCQLLLH